MVTYICMGLIVLFLAFEVLFKAKLQDENKGFFDLSNTKAMRGFWCFIIILVHTPEVFQNPVQDMIGSFAYIGVTFFFMTSAYGLKIGVSKDPDSIKYFWRKRLPKLLIPYYLVSFLGALFLLLEGKAIYWPDVLLVRRWVLWLLICYIIFWIVYRIAPGGRYNDIIISATVIILSLTVFFLEKYISGTTWTTEIYGFVWGLLLANTKDRFKAFGVKSWLVKSAVLCAASGVLGIAYLKFKTVYFAGGYLLKIILGFMILLFILEVTTRVAIGNRISLFLGGISYEIFLLHGHVFGVFEHFFRGIGSGAGILSVIVTTVLLAVIVNAAGRILTGRLTGSGANRNKRS